ncbi:MAG: glycosyltransferase family 39 protein [Chloroflexi bacterium]|nr:glycosyltransferase family 39 protein [Chloroflexota bacterium]
MLTSLIVLPALCLWTGFGLLHLLPIKRTTLDAATAIFVSLVFGVLLLGWVATAATELGVFRAEAIVVLGLLVGAAGAWRAKRRGLTVQLERTPRLESAFLIALIGLMVALYFRSHEFIFGGADAGVYINLGATISRSGGLILNNPDLAALPPDDIEQLFRPQPPNQLPRYYHLPGFYIADDNAGQITPQFYPLHPVWLAVAYGLRGLAGSLNLTPLWGLLGVLAVYFAVREAFGRVRLAALAAGLLAITSTQIWFARYPTAETLTQFLLFAALYGLARHARTREGWAAVLAGMALGQVMLVRIDMYFLLAVPLIYAAYLRLRRQLDRRFWLFAGPLLALTAHSLIHAVWQSWPYFYNTYFGGIKPPIPMPILIGGLIVTVAAFLVLDRRVGARSDWVRRIEPWWRVALTLAAIGLVLLAAYAYFIRPLSADATKQINYWYAESTIPDVEPLNMVRLGWYLSPLGLLLSVIGCALLVRERTSERTWALLGVGLFFTLLYTYKTYNNPHHIYVMRRYMPAVFPMLALGAAYALERLADWKPIGRVSAIGLGIITIALLIDAGHVSNAQIDYAGGLDQYRAFSAQIPPDAIVLFDDRGVVGVTALFGTPLAYLDGHTVLDLQEDRIDAKRLDVLVAGWLFADRTVVIVGGPLASNQLCARWQCRPSGAMRFEWPQLEASYEHFPAAVVRPVYDLTLTTVEAVK